MVETFSIVAVVAIAIQTARTDRILDQAGVD